MKVSELVRRLESFDGNTEVCIETDECNFAVRDALFLEDVGMVGIKGGRSLHPDDDGSPEVDYYHKLADDVRRYYGQ